AIGGGLIATIGVAVAFYLNAVSFLAVLYSLTLMRFPERLAKPRRGILADIAGGMRYLRSEPSLRTLVTLALLPMVFGTPYMAMLAVFAKDVLDVGGSGLGLLTASAGLGAVIGALYVGSANPTTRRGR